MRVPGPRRAVWINGPPPFRPSEKPSIITETKEGGIRKGRVVSYQLGTRRRCWACVAGCLEGPRSCEPRFRKTTRLALTLGRGPCFSRQMCGVAGPARPSLDGRGTCSGGSSYGNVQRERLPRIHPSYPLPDVRPLSEGSLRRLREQPTHSTLPRALFAWEFCQRCGASANSALFRSEGYLRTCAAPGNPRRPL